MVKCDSVWHGGYYFCVAVLVTLELCFSTGRFRLRQAGFPPVASKKIKTRPKLPKIALLNSLNKYSPSISVDQYCTTGLETRL